MATGLPTVLGWDFHERQWGRSQEEVDARKADVESIYRGVQIAPGQPERALTDDEMLALLAKYKVRFVVLGETERAEYGITASDVDRFRRTLAVVFESGSSIVFQVPTATPGGRS
jgi:uncharacterized membrane protein